jgi:predicted  nucleic acid-binding Zn-ribbon protein
MELQNLDSKLDQLRSLRGDLPNQVERMHRDLEEAQRKQEEREVKRQAYQKEKGMIEVDVKALEGRQTKYQNQLFQVKTNREYDAVTLEIESVKQNIEMKESRLLELMDLEEDIKHAIEAGQSDIEKLSETLEERRLELDERMAKTEKDEIALCDKREKVLRNLTPRILATYERIRKAKNGFAVTPVVRNACGGCFKTLPPQRILEIRQMNRIQLCEVCGRILVWDPQKSEAGS